MAIFAFEVLTDHFHFDEYRTSSQRNVSTWVLTKAAKLNT